MANDKDPCVRLAVWPEPDAAPCRVEDKLRIDAGPGFGNAERGPLVNEPRRGGGHVHHREPNKCGPPPPANGYRTGPSGSESWSGLPRRGPWRPCRRRRTAGRTGWGAGLRPGHAARRAGVPRGGGRRWTGSARALGTTRAAGDAGVARLGPNERVREFTGALAAGQDLPAPPPGTPGPFARADPGRVRPLLAGLRPQDVHRAAAAAAPDHGPAVGASRCRGHRARIPLKFG